METFEWILGFRKKGIRRMEIEKNIISNSPPAPEQNPWVLTEPELKRLAHLPLLSLFYLIFQRQFSATPVTALELAAYLSVEVKVAECILEYLLKKGIVRSFKNDMPAYSIGKTPEQIPVSELFGMLGDIQEILKVQKNPMTEGPVDDSDQKYRKLYSELASEILQLFGEESANKLPL